MSDDKKLTRIDLDDPNDFHKLTPSVVEVLEAKRFALNYTSRPLTDAEREERDALNAWRAAYRKWQREQT